jgi:hypothetical protein
MHTASGFWSGTPDHAYFIMLEIRLNNRTYSFLRKTLTRTQFEQLADVPPEDEWLANFTRLKTRGAYKEDAQEFIGFNGLNDYMGLRSYARATAAINALSHDADIAKVQEWLGLC